MEATKKSFNAVPVSADGVFTFQIEDLPIPKSVNVLLNLDVTESELTFQDVHVVSSCQFSGWLQARLFNVDSSAGYLPEVLLTGPLDAFGTSPACTGKGP